MDGYILNFCQCLGGVLPDPVSGIAYRINLEPPF